MDQILGVQYAAGSSPFGDLARFALHLVSRRKERLHEMHGDKGSLASLAPTTCMFVQTVSAAAVQQGKNATPNIEFANEKRS